jgi:hypothetical protein
MVVERDLVRQARLVGPLTCGRICSRSRSNHCWPNGEIRRLVSRVLRYPVHPWALVDEREGEGSTQQSCSSKVLTHQIGPLLYTTF